MTPDATAPLRSLVLGAGLMGRWHARAIRQAGGLLAAVVDADPAAARRLATRHRCAAESSLAAALARGGVDVVHVCTPSPTHAALVVEAIEAGTHVLVEKPIAPTAAACDRLLDLAASRSLLLCPVLQFVCQRGVGRALGALPGLGPVRHIDFVACSAGADGMDDAMRAAVALEICHHALALLGRLCPDVEPAGWQVRHDTAGELRAVAAVGGATASILVSMRGRPTRSTCRAVADGGTIHLDFFHGFSVIERLAPTRLGKVARPFVLSGAVAGAAAANLVRRAATREPAYPGLAAFISRFYRAVRTGGPAPISAEEARRIARVAEAIGRMPGHQ